MGDLTTKSVLKKRPEGDAFLSDPDYRHLSKADIYAITFKKLVEQKDKDGQVRMVPFKNKQFSGGVEYIVDGDLAKVYEKQGVLESCELIHKCDSPEPRTTALDQYRAQVNEGEANASSDEQPDGGEGSPAGEQSGDGGAPAGDGTPGDGDGVLGDL